MDNISDTQWLVIGMLLLMALGELVLHPQVEQGLVSFLGAFKPAPAVTQGSKK